MKKIIFLFLLTPYFVLAEENTTDPEDIILFNFLNTRSENGQFLYRTGKDLITTIEQLETILELKLTKLNNVALPDGLKKLKQLQRLNFSGNRLSSLPQWMESFKELQELDLSDNDFECIPPVIQKLPALTSLNFHLNKLRAIPTENNPFEDLEELEFLNLSSNPSIYFFDSKVTFKSLPALKVLDLSNCNLFEIPDGIAHLRALKELHFHFNQISTLGSLHHNELFKNLFTLEVLDLSNNSIHTFFKGFNQYIKQLKTLNLNNTKLTSLPSDINLLINLEKFFVKRELANQFLGAIPEDPSKYALYNTNFEFLSFYYYEAGLEGLNRSLLNTPGPTENLKIK